MRTRLIMGAATGVALAVSVAACGGQGAGSPAHATGRVERAPLRSTPSATASPGARLAHAAARTAGVTFRTEITTRLVTPYGQTSELRVRGVYRTGAHPAADLKPVGGNRAAPRELRFVDDVLYIQRGHVMRPGGGGKPWTRVTRTTSSMSLIRTYAAVDRGRPAPLLRMIATSGDARRAGMQTVGGVSTTHYAGTFDAESAARRVAATDRLAVADLTAFHTMRFDVWLDSAGRPRRLALTGSAAHRGYSLTQTVDRYDVPVRVTAPSPEQADDGDGPVLPHAPRAAQ